MASFTEDYCIAKKDMTQVLLDLPVSTENELRIHMLTAICLEYTKYLQKKDLTVAQIRSSIDGLLADFKQKYSEFSSSNYTQHINKVVQKYLLENTLVKDNVKKIFLRSSASLLKANIHDNQVQSDLEQAQESLKRPEAITQRTLALENLYLESVVSKLISLSSIDSEFLSRLQ